MIETIIIGLVALLIFVLILSVIVLYNSLAWGTVLWLFWAWFLLPVFPVLGALTFWKAIGLMFFIDLFKNQVYPPQPKFKEHVIENDGKKNQLTATLLVPWIILLIGFLMHLLIPLVG